ncbi:Stress responsive A/B Barrel Domain protein [Tritonibacter multivorans]|uniref:Stress responsive A/B Barrel Domain protein n=1 Tax=Tritonibacter multivorans TaxID=928856 RepID=A0A0P1G7X6_9RHOB|nr:Dabb family protein [Tritonibacter multivorans]MDA7422288.1 Dabb family protein [Tritonibacter multivorans]CUH77763.1 Stress responsive A/B Barrel Domain protein [Tritonibacter multivorans]SFD12231.1 Stress responsive A/B Barrel Domain [Tritonibacter multivorans]
MILHCVFCNFSDAATAAQRQAILSELRDFAMSLRRCLSAEFGPNRDFEQKTQGYSHGFVLRFRDADALAEYAEHPTHRALGARLCALCTGGADGILVYDLEVPDRRSR